MALLCLSLPASGAAEVVGLRIGAHLVRAEVVNTEATRAQGLMHRHQICGDCGMLFVFPQPGKYDFWMMNTLIPLSIAFISDEGRIMKIVEMTPGDGAETYEGVAGTRYALEMRAGWFGRNGLGVGAALHDMRMVERYLATAE